MYKKHGAFLMVLGFLLLTAAAGLTAYNIWDTNRAADSAELITQQLTIQIPARKPAPMDTELISLPSLETAPESMLMPEVEIPDYLLNPEMEMPVEIIDGVAYIGILEIPDLELSLPVATDWSYPLLRNSPCRYTGSAYQNDIVIAAHNYERHFGNLGKLHIDSEISFTDMDGNVFVYRVTEFETLAPTAIESMTSFERGLTLFTCTIGGRSRFALRAERTEIP